MCNVEKMNLSEMEDTIIKQQREVIEVKKSILNELIDIRLEILSKRYSNGENKLVRLINEIDKDIKNELSPTLETVR